MPTLSRETAIAALVFAAALAVQSFYWIGQGEYPDSEYWLAAAMRFAEGTLPSYQSLVPVHPATTILLPAALLIFFGAYALYAIPVTMVALIASLCGIISYLCHVLRPHGYWWLAVSALLIASPQFLKMTIPSAAAALIVGVFVMAVLYGREKGFSRNLLALLGVCLGTLLATRIDVGVAMILLSLPYLFFRVGKRSFAVGIFALLFFAALNPFLWINPADYVSSFALQATVHFSDPGGLGYTLSSLAFPIVGFLLGVLAILARTSSMPRDFLLWLVGMSVMYCTLLLLSPHHPVRYFFPIIIVWQIMLPLLFFDLVERMDFFKASKKKIYVECITAALFCAYTCFTAYLILY